LAFVVPALAASTAQGREHCLIDAAAWANASRLFSSSPFSIVVLNSGLRESPSRVLASPLVHLAELHANCLHAGRATQAKLSAIRGSTCGGAVHALVMCLASDEEENNMSQHWNLSYMEAGQQSNAASKLAEGDQAWAVKASEAGDDEDEPMEDAIQYQEDDQRAAQSTRNMPASTYESDDEAASAAQQHPRRWRCRRCCCFEWRCCWRQWW
jgi:hypothetical protein